MRALEGIHLIKSMNDFIKEHFLQNIVLYIIVTLSFTIGVSTGALTVNALNGTQNEELMNYLNDFFRMVSEQNINNLEILKISVSNNIKQVIFLWIFSITVIGIPFILILIGIKGFVTGFTVGFLIKYFNAKGILFSIVGIFPQSLIMVPCYVLLGVMGINYSVSTLKNNKKSNRTGRLRKEDVKAKFLLYSTMVIIIFCILTLGSIVEAYISPVFIKKFIN